MSSLPLPESPMAAENEACDWGEMPSDALVSVFGKLDVIEILTGAGLVCRAWHRLAASDPMLWRRVDMRHMSYGYEGERLQTEKVEDMARAAIDPSAGTMEPFFADTIVNDDLLRCLSQRSGKRLQTEKVEAMARAAIDRSAGTMEAFFADIFVNDDLLRYLSQRSGKFFQLRLHFFLLKDGWRHGLQLTRGSHCA
jgi:hypothetical protein